MSSRDSHEIAARLAQLLEEALEVVTGEDGGNGLDQADERWVTDPVSARPADMQFDEQRSRRKTRMRRERKKNTVQDILREARQVLETRGPGSARRRTTARSAPLQIGRVRLEHEHEPNLEDLFETSWERVGGERVEGKRREDESPEGHQLEYNGSVWKQPNTHVYQMTDCTEDEHLKHSTGVFKGRAGASSGTINLQMQQSRASDEICASKTWYSTDAEQEVPAVKMGRQPPQPAVPGRMRTPTAP